MDDFNVVKSTAVVHSSQTGGQDRLDSSLKPSRAQEKRGEGQGIRKGSARKINPTEFKGMKGKYQGKKANSRA